MAQGELLIRFNQHYPAPSLRVKSLVALTWVSDKEHEHPHTRTHRTSTQQQWLPGEEGTRDCSSQPAFRARQPLQASLVSLQINPCFYIKSTPRTSPSQFPISFP